MSATDIEWIKKTLSTIQQDMKTVIDVTADNTNRISRVEVNCEAHSKAKEAFRNWMLTIAAVASVASVVMGALS